MNVFDQGLLHLGATKAARILSGPNAGYWVLNDKTTGIVSLVRVPAGSSVWNLTGNNASVGNKPFPYGYDVAGP